MCESDSLASPNASATHDQAVPVPDVESYRKEARCVRGIAGHVVYTASVQCPTVKIPLAASVRIATSSRAMTT